MPISLFSLFSIFPVVGSLSVQSGRRNFCSVILCNLTGSTEAIGCWLEATECNIRKESRGLDGSLINSNCTTCDNNNVN
ncbi:hypothetical protein chiPu_0001896 [Chiloscyllium punctatum]|uniref:Secreted protein n=1 Tax=Chiloscyllium punctatum TaxID=137246 RepID=A0A401RZI9_CHIPU|nr:hypothetical protein [Chiloscyllium punctatum]